MTMISTHPCHSSLQGADLPTWAVRSVPGPPQSAGGEPAEEESLSGMNGSDLMRLLTQGIAKNNGDGPPKITPTHQAGGSDYPSSVKSLGGLPSTGGQPQSTRPGPSVLPPVPLDQKDMMRRFTEILGKG